MLQRHMLFWTRVMWYGDFDMSLRNVMALHRMARTSSLVCVVLLLSVCVLVQVLGAPISLLDQSTWDISSSSLSEGFSLPAMALDPKVRGLPCPPRKEYQSSLRSQVLATTIFHPPVQA